MNKNIKLTPKYLLFYLMGLCGIIENVEVKVYEERIYPLLSVLWQEIGKKEVQWEIRRFWSLCQKEVLQFGLHEQSILENWNDYSNKESGTRIFEEDSIKSIELSKQVFYLWESWKNRYTPHRWGLSQQQFEQFNVFMSQLPFEKASQEEDLCNLWETSKVLQLLQQTLYKIQEIWRSTLSQEQSTKHLIIRKLTPLTCFKLMGFEKKDLESCREFNDSALFHVAGDSIVTTCLVAIIGSMTNIDYVKVIKDYTERLTKEK